MNKLQTMLDMQEMFQNKVGYDFANMTTEEQCKYIKEMALHTEHELHELLTELPYFKPWGNYATMSSHEISTAIKKVEHELVDAWHFFMNIMIALNMDANDLFTKYTYKHAINNVRQDEGYTHKEIFGSAPRATEEDFNE